MSKTKAKPTSGQSGPEIKLAIDDLNTKENAVVAALIGVPRRTLADLAGIAFPRNKKANSWARNSLRRLVCGAIVEKLEPGVYKLSAAGARKARNTKGRK